jgi:hypothetical protein
MYLHLLLCVLIPATPQEASGAADAARQEALELRSQLTAAHTTITVLQVRYNTH